MFAVACYSLRGIAIIIIQPRFFDILVVIDLSFIGLSRCWSPAFQIAIHFHGFCSHLLDIRTWKAIRSSNTDHDYLVLLHRDNQSVIRLVPCAIGTHVWAGTTSEMVRSWNMSQGSNLFHRLSVLDKVRISWSAASHSRLIREREGKGEYSHHVWLNNQINLATFSGERVGHNWSMWS